VDGAASAPVARTASKVVAAQAPKAKPAMHKPLASARVDESHFQRF
jgi:hypothetical protein